MIELPEGTVAAITGHATDFFANMSPILYLILGILLGTLVIVFLIRALQR
jgi:hypothetical protein